MYHLADATVGVSMMLTPHQNGGENALYLRLSRTRRCPVSTATACLPLCQRHPRAEYSPVYRSARLATVPRAALSRHLQEWRLQDYVPLAIHTLTNFFPK